MIPSFLSHPECYPAETPITGIPSPVTSAVLFHRAQSLHHQDITGRSQESPSISFPRVLDDAHILLTSRLNSPVFSDPETLRTFSDIPAFTLWLPDPGG